MFLLFLFNFICQLRSKDAEEKIHIRNAWQKPTRAFDAVLSMGGTDMRTNPPRVGIPLALGIVLLLSLHFQAVCMRVIFHSHNRPVSMGTVNRYWPFP